ncbi:MAG: L-threonylcarbamoyladenylate synthase [Flavobacteriales bacterium]|jgi:L-threonylcarbamoyladenylate synthase
MHDEIVKALEVLKNGGVILYPTDTVWGIGCDATNEAAVNKVFEIKNRPQNKSFVVLADTEMRVEQYFKEVPEVAWQLFETADRPLTVILNNPINIAPSAIAPDNSVGFRICQDMFCKKLIQQFKRPIVSTSANISGAPTPLKFDEISKDILGAVDYVVNLRQEEQTKAKPSSIVKLGVNGEIRIIRK